MDQWPYRESGINGERAQSLHLSFILRTSCTHFCGFAYISKRDSWIILSLSKGKCALATPRQMCFGTLGDSRGKRMSDFELRHWVECRGVGKGVWSRMGGGGVKCPWSLSKGCCLPELKVIGHATLIYYPRNTSLEMQKNFLCCILWLPFNVSLGLLEGYQYLGKNCFVNSPFPHV